MPPNLPEERVILAGGLVPKLKKSYFRIGHMGSVNSNDFIAVLNLMEPRFIEPGLLMKAGERLPAFQNELMTKNLALV